MSDAPLFQNTDDQEVAYAPQELPRGSSGEVRAATDDGNQGTSSNTGDAVLPLAAGGIANGGSATGSPGGTGAGGNPAIGAAAVNTLANEREDGRDRSV